MSEETSIDVPEGWDIGGNTNGGYLMLRAAKFMREQAQRAMAVTVTGHFLRPVAAGPAQLTCDEIKRGRLLTTMRGDLIVDGRLALTLLGAFSDLDRQGQGSQFYAGSPPPLPPLEDCVPAWHLPTADALYRRIQIRCAADDPTILGGKRGGTGALEAWIAPPEGAEVATCDDLLLLVDCFPPPVFDLDLPINWTPTVELTVHVRGVPAPGWLRARCSTRFVRDGLLEESVELWDSADQLVAQSRQLAVEPRPR
ncbi:MAG: thioesterase family protein [Pseudomonadota bacterium]